MKIDLYESRAAIFDSNTPNTTARCEIRNDVYGVTWEIDTVQIETDSLQTFGASRFYLYLNSETRGGVRDSTYQGDSSTSETKIMMKTGDRLIGVWTGGDALANATLTIRGTKDTGRAF